MRRWSGMIVLFVVAALVLGFHWISIDIGAKRKFCVLTKGHLSFSETVVLSSSSVKFAVQHPSLAARIVTGEAHCFEL